MPFYIMYFNLKDGVSEGEFVEKTKEMLDNIQDEIKGLKTTKLYRHHFFGAHPRTYQIHFEFEDFGTWDRFLALLRKDTKYARLLEEWQNLFDFKTHYDEFVREIPL